MFLPGKPHGQRSLVGYSLKGHKVSDTAEWLSIQTEAGDLGLELSTKCCPLQGAWCFSLFLHKLTCGPPTPFLGPCGHLSLPPSTTFCIKGCISLCFLSYPKFLSLFFLLYIFFCKFTFMIFLIAPLPHSCPLSAWVLRNQYNLSLPKLSGTICSRLLLEYWNEVSACFVNDNISWLCITIVTANKTVGITLSLALLSQNAGYLKSC